MRNRLVNGTVGIFMLNLFIIINLIPYSLVWAGGFKGSIERAISKKFGQRSAVDVFEKKTAGGYLSASEQAALRNELVKLDKKTLKLIEKHYGMYISPKRLQNEKQIPTKYIYEKSNKFVMKNLIDTPR